VGLHQRYAEILGNDISVSSLCLSKKEEEIDAIAKKWASVISNKYVREDAEEAARIALRHGIKELPELREVDLGGKKRFHGLTRANFHPAICEGAPNIINVNKRAYKTWVKDTEDAIRGGWHAQSNTILHELGHYIDFCNDPDYFRSVEHEWKMDKADKELIKKQLSEYSLTNRAEFEAELNAAIMRGKVLPKELLSYSHMNNVNTELAKSLLSLGAGEDVCLPSEDISKGFKDAMKALFHQKGSSFSIDIMADENVQSLIEAHTSVLDRNLQRLEMSDLMRQRLTRSNYIFSGLKTFHELNEAFPSLLDENGNKKTFERFLNDVRKIDETYNSNYLRAEYNFVQASAEMAAKWEKFMEDGDHYYLQYRTQHDDKVRPEHASLDRVTLPPSDSFWESYYPPNGWNCRCTVVQVLKRKYEPTPHDEAMSLGEEALQTDKKGIFRFNSGKEQKTVPDYNPYTIKRCRDCDIAKGKLDLDRKPVADNELCAACRLVHKCANSYTDSGKTNLSVEDRDAILAKPLDEQYFTKYIGIKGKVLQHELACSTAEDYKRVLDVAKAFADEFGDCLLNPEIQFTATNGRRKVYDMLPEDSKANPDLKVGEFGYIDVKSPEKVMNCCRNANHASDAQHACVCLTDHCFRKPITERQIQDRNKAIWDSKDYHHDYIFWYVNGKLRKYKRPME
jgi:SPP1 gp7 family putative phage head morphogenesis protein